jgi:transposase
MKAYSVDLRIKVLAFFESGHTAKETMKIFSIGRTTLYDWIKRKKSNNLEAKKHHDYPIRKVDPKKLKAYVEKHPDHTLREMAEAFDCSIPAIDSWLKKLKITRKKRQKPTKKAMQRPTRIFEKVEKN